MGRRMPTYLRWIPNEKELYRLLAHWACGGNQEFPPTRPGKTPLRLFFNPGHPPPLETADE